MIIKFLRTFIVLIGVNAFLCAHEVVSQKTEFDNLVSVQQKFSEADQKEAFNMLKDTVSKANNIAKKNTHTSDAKMQFAQIMTNALAVSHIAKFSLGREFKKYYPENFKQFKKFVGMLSSYLLKIYATQEKIEVFGSIDMKEDDINAIPELSPRKNRLTYKAVFESENGPLNTKFVLIKVDNNHYKIFDIIVEGIGLLSNLRSQVSTLSVNKSIDAFLKEFSKNA